MISEGGLLAEVWISGGLGVPEVEAEVGSEVLDVAWVVVVVMARWDWEEEICPPAQRRLSYNNRSTTS